MTARTLYLSLLTSSMTISESKNPSALASLELTTEYAFDSNVIAKVKVVDNKTPVIATDPLNNLVFKITFEDKVDGSVITEMQGRLFTGGGADELDAQFANNMSYAMAKLDYYGALDSAYDFFEEVVTQYSAGDAADIKAALATVGALNTLGDYRTKEVTLNVPASTVVDLTPTQLKNALLDMAARPRYIVTAEIDNLANIEALAEVMAKINCHVLIDIGDIREWELAVAFSQAIDINDHRLWVFWNPNTSRPSNAATVRARKKWRPCIGDYLAQLLIRNAATNASGIPPVHKPIAGYDYPLAFRDMEKFADLSLDEEAQNALASAGVNVVINERFEGGDRWIYGDVLTQYGKDTSALELINSSEITTYTENVVVGIVKKHLLKAMNSFIPDATDECAKFLDACATAGLITLSDELGGAYYALSITRRTDNPFTKADVKLSRSPEGCARQVYFESTVTK